MRYFGILLLLFVLNCKKKESVLTEDYKYLEGKWRIKSQPFDFFPFDYDDTNCTLDKNTTIEIRDDGDIIFSSENCSFQKKYQISMDTFLEIRYKNRRIYYGITKKSNHEVILFSGNFPKYIAKRHKMDIDEILYLEKRGFEITLEKIEE